MTMLVIFDCDGTLVDSQHMIVQAMATAFAANGLACPGRGAILHTVGLSLIEAMQRLAPDGDDEQHAALAADYRRAFHALRVRPDHAEPMFAGARDALLALADRPGVRLGIATGKSRRGVAAFLAREGLDGLFATIQTADDAPSKPHPAMILQALNETRAPREAAVMIGDTAHDMRMAVNAQVRPLGVAWGYHAIADLRAAGAQAIAADFAGLMRLLDAPCRDDAA